MKSSYITISSDALVTMATRYSLPVNTRNGAFKIVHQSQSMALNHPGASTDFKAKRSEQWVIHKQKIILFQFASFFLYEALWNKSRSNLVDLALYLCALGLLQQLLRSPGFLHSFCYSPWAGDHCCASELCSRQHDLVGKEGVQNLQE